jgi:uncharacterized protein (DUF427 family)
MSRPQRIEPGPGQESVWDYPRPPAVVASEELVRVVHAGHVVAETRRAIRVLETSQPPGYYLPLDDLDTSVLRASSTRTFCEWKGAASYVDLVVPGAEPVTDAGWTYPSPSSRFAAIADHVAFYPQRVDACFVDDEQVAANEGDFYGGWITSKVVGPFKGGRGSWGW